MRTAIDELIERELLNGKPLAFILGQCEAMQAKEPLTMQQYKMICKRNKVNESLWQSGFEYQKQIIETAKKLITEVYAN